MAEENSITNAVEKYLQALWEDLQHKNQLEKDRIKKIVEENKELSAKLEASYAQASKAITVSSILLPTQKITLASLQASETNLNDKLQKNRTYTMAMEKKVKEETLRLRESFNKILNLNDIKTMPYHDVESATKELEQKLEQMSKNIEEDKEKSSQRLKDIEEEYAAIMQDVGNMEKVNDKLSENLSNQQRIVNDKLVEMGMEPTDDIYTIRAAKEKIKREIAELKEKLEKLNAHKVKE